MESSQGGLEEHLEKILRVHQPLYAGYKLHLASVLNATNNDSNTIVRELGDSFIRFHIAGDHYNLNKTHYVYGIGNIIPTIKWRKLLRSSQGLYQHVLLKKTTFLPIYSLSLDKFLTFVYWGEKQFFFDPDMLKKLDLENFLIDVDKPSSFKISAANVAWPKSVDNIYATEANLSNFVNQYVFNTLFPPELNDISNIWSDSPFLIVGDQFVEFYSVHKTIASLDLKTVRRGDDQMLVTAYILDNTFSTRKVTVGIDEELLDLANKPVFETVLTKGIALSARHQVPRVRLSIYPFESISLFAQSHGILFTALSLILRKLYLESGLAFDIGVRTDAVLTQLRHLISQKVFNRYKWDDLASKVLTSQSANSLINMLGVYKEENGKISYLHPSLIECLAVLFRDMHKIENVPLRTALISLLDILGKINFQKNTGLSRTLEVQGQLEKVFGTCHLNDVDRVMRTFNAAQQEVIPFGKMLGKAYTNI